MPDELLQRLRRFHDDTFPGVQDRFEAPVKDGQHPTFFFIGCSDSRLVPYLLTGTGPGELFIVRTRRRCSTKSSPSGRVEPRWPL